MTADYQPTHLRCPDCRAEVLIDVRVEHSVVGWGGRDHSVLEVTSAYEEHDCDPHVRA